MYLFKIKDKGPEGHKHVPENIRVCIWNKSH